MNKKTAEKIATIVLAAFLAIIFVIQNAHAFSATCHSYTDKSIDNEKCLTIGKQPYQFRYYDGKQGLFFIGIQYISNKDYLGSNVSVKWDRVGNDTSVMFQHLYTFFSSQHIFAALGIPATTGFASGVVIGLAKGL